MAAQILLVDDNPTNLQVLYQTLEGHGYRLLAARSGKDAIAIAERTTPDLILLDVMMPGMDGPATLEALRRLQSGGRTPIVFMTARVQSQEVDRYRELGAVDVIAKPFDPLKLADTVREIWDSLED